MHGIGKTIFSGNRIEEFQVEMLGVLENIGPKQNLILARLSGGPLAETGVLQGMSGSPVYIDGKLAGAVALAFPFAKDAITGIRPIEEMVRVTEAGRGTAPTQVARNAGVAGVAFRRQGPHPPVARPPGSFCAAMPRCMDIATPVSFARIHPRHLDQFRAAASRPGPRAGAGTVRGRPSNRAWAIPPRSSPAR